MDNHYKIIKEKQNKMKLNNKKSITNKNSSYNAKTSNKTNVKKNIKIPNYNNSYVKNRNFLIFKNLQKYNTTITKYNVYITNAIIFDQRNHIVTVFKNYLLWDETSEFLKRYYRKKDNVERLPRIAEYYEQYTLYTPNYFGHEGLIILIMLKFIKRKNKYLKYLEEKEEEEEKNKNKNKNKKGIKKDFVPLLENEIKSLANTKSKSQYSSSIDMNKNTLELTNYENDSIYKNLKKREPKNIIISEKNKNKINKDISNEKPIKNSISFTEIFDDLSSNFSILINNNNYKDYNHKDKKIPVKSYTNRAYLIKKEKEKEINSKSSFKKLNLKKNNKKNISKKQTPNKQIIESRNEQNNLKYKDIHKISNFKKKINVMKKITSIKDSKLLKEKGKEKEKHNENRKEEKIANIYNNDIKGAQRLSNNIISKKDKDKERDSNFSKNITNKQSLNIINNNNNGGTNKLIKNDVKINIMNTITDTKSHYYSLGKLKKNKKQRSAIKKLNIKSLNLVNLNQNVIPNLKKLVHNKKEKRIIFPRNINCIYNNNSNNNSNKLNSMKIEKIEHTKLLTDKDKENVTLVNNTSESSKLIKFNDNIFFNYNQINSNSIFNKHISHKVDLFAQKVGKLIKKKNISLIGDNISSKDINSNNIILERNDKNDNSIANNMNHMHYKKNSVLRQFNSKKDFNFNVDKNNLFYNYNNISNNSINSSSSSSLNNLNRKRYKISSNQFSYNNSITKNRKSLQKINLNLNLQINFNINIDKKKNKKLILGNKLSNRIFNEVNNKNNNNKYKNNKGNISNSNINNNISVPLTQRCYYNINNKIHKFLGNYRSSSSSNSKNKKKGKNNM